MRSWMIIAAFLVAGCPEQTPEAVELGKYRIEIRLMGDPELDLRGVVVRFNDRDQRKTGPDGTLRVGYLGAHQSPLDIAIMLPDNLQSPQPTKRRFTLKHDAAGRPEAIRFELPVEKKTDGGSPYVVVVESPCKDQAVLIDNVEVGRTNRDGYFSHRMARYVGQTLAVTLEARNQCARLECRIPLTENNALISIEGKCPDNTDLRAAGRAPGPARVERSEPAVVRSAPPPPKPAVAALAGRDSQVGDAAPVPTEPRPEVERSSAKRTRKARRPRRTPRKTKRSSSVRREAPSPERDETEEDEWLAVRRSSQKTVRATAPFAPPPLRDTGTKRKPAFSERELESEAAEPSLDERAAPTRRRTLPTLSGADATDRGRAAEPPGDDDLRPTPGSNILGIIEDDPREAPAVPTAVETPTPRRVPHRLKGSRRVEVTCRPTGLDLYVDDVLAVADCSTSVAWIQPGVRKLVLRSPPGPNLCPPSRPRFVDIAKIRRATPKVVVETDCQRSCTETVRTALRNRLPSAEELSCLSDIKPRDEEFLDARLLRAHAHIVAEELAQAERVLSAAVRTRRGQTDPEVHARLAEVLGRRKQLEEASREAEKAWRFRMKFRGNRDQRETWILSVLKLRAGFFEQLFYRDRDRADYERAVKTYRTLEHSATRASKDRLLQVARASRTRLESQEAQLLGE